MKPDRVRHHSPGYSDEKLRYLWLPPAQGHGVQSNPTPRAVASLTTNQPNPHCPHRSFLSSLGTKYEPLLRPGRRELRRQRWIRSK